jgi:peptidoglycan/LPS O-acetylase OafA/YrhL
MMLEPWTAAAPGVVRTLLHGGYLAVQAFFILSGFVLARSYASTQWTRQNVIKFGMARVARIYPVYLFSLIAVSVFIAETLAKPTRTVAEKAGLLGYYVFVLQGWRGSLGVGWNTPAWTLSCEFFFYACFPVLFYWMRNARLPKILAVFAVSIVTPILLAHAGVPWDWKPIYHLSDFLAGIAAAGLFDIVWRLRGRGYLVYVPATAAALWFILNTWVFKGTLIDLNTMLRPLYVLLLIGLGLGDRYFAAFFAWRPVEYLGKASYCMYILHVPALWWYSRYKPFSWGASEYLVIVLVASIAAFELVETPANNWIRGWSVQLSECQWSLWAPSHTTASKPLTEKSIACSEEPALT